MTEIASNAADERKTKIIIHKRQQKQKGLRLRQQTLITRTLVPQWNK